MPPDPDPHDVPDEVLVLAAILGDLEAFDELVLRHRPAVVRVAAAIVGDTDAEDVAQDALLLAFKALPSIDDPASFGSWLRVITRHRALRSDQQRTRRQNGHVPLDAVLLERLDALPAAPPPTGDPDLHAALDRLPAEYADVLRLQFLDELPQKRIASLLDVPVSTVKWRAYRGKQLLRDALAPAGIL